MSKKEIKRLQELAGITSEIKQVMNSERFLKFVESHKAEIAKLSRAYKKVIMDHGVKILDLGYYSFKDEFYTIYEDYPYEEFIEDFKKYPGTICLLGEELSTCFVASIMPEPMKFACVVSSNDATFFGTTPATKNPFEKYTIDGVDLYIVWGIPDPGS